MRGSWEPRRGRSRSRIVTLVLVAGLVAAGCGGGGDDTADDVALEDIEPIVDIDPCELLDGAEAQRLAGGEVGAASRRTEDDGTTRCEFAFADGAASGGTGSAIAASLSIGPGDEGDLPAGSAIARSLSLGDASGVEDDDGTVRVAYVVREVLVRVEVVPEDGVVDDELIEKVVEFTETTEAPVTEAVTGEPFVDDDPSTTTTSEPDDEPAEGQTVEPDGPPVTLSVEEAGGSDAATFEADAGDVFFIDILSLEFDAAGTTDCVGLSVVDETGVTLTGTGTACTDEVFLDRVPIDQNGTYEVLLDPNGPVTGSISFALERVEDEEQTTTIGGGAVTMTVTGRGGISRVEFEGRPGQAIRVPVPAATRDGDPNQCLLVRLEEPEGFSRNFTCALEDGTAFIDRVELTRPGTHAIIFDPDGEMTGSVQVSVEAA